MSKRNPSLLVEDMLDAFRKIRPFTTEGLSYSSFSPGRKTIDAVVRNLEVWERPSPQIPEEFTSRPPDVPWGAKIQDCVIGIVHDYFGLDFRYHLADLFKNDLHAPSSAKTAACKNIRRLCMRSGRQQSGEARKIPTVQAPCRIFVSHA